ncbi:MAG: hypothetical protein QOG09_733, partial [Solirubrobacterales bacterium]|nr:hypothetical protein [Solirubrobacterales bacterium]
KETFNRADSERKPDIMRAIAGAGFEPATFGL